MGFHMFRWIWLLALGLASSATASPLFSGPDILEVTLSGPLSTLFAQKKDRLEYGFEITAEGQTRHVAVRIRGKSRIEVCRFPPLRLNFAADDTADSVFEFQDKLKLVTHCRSNNARAENSVLNEYLAYRIFNLISEKSYRVRLLKIRYEDSVGKQKHLERPYYGFLIESDEALASRLGGRVAELEGVVYSKLDQMQIALLNVFYYLIGNRDWSLVKAEGADACCHNLDLYDVENSLVAVPYDFDLSGLVGAMYSGPMRRNLNRFIGRKYNGYCQSSIETVGDALRRIKSQRAEMLSLAQDLPAVEREYAENRRKFLQEFFDEAESEQALLDQFAKDCIGKKRSANR
jgi:hypothetical protein